VTAFSLVLATQALDALGMVLGLRYGHEANPVMAALLAAGGLGALLAVKMAVAAAMGVAAADLARYWRWVPATVGVVGCVGCLSALLVVVGV
jgi:hypothetical protein